MQRTHLSIWLRPDGFSYRADGGEQCHHLVSPAGDDFYRRMEDAMMDCDDLMDTYGARTCIVETTRFALVPPDADDATAQAMYRLTQPETERPEIVLRDGPILFGLDEDFYRFMQRTFDGELAFTHPLNRLRALCGDATDALPPAGPSIAPAQVIVCITPEAIDLLVYRTTLLLANRYETAELANMVYYIINTWQRCALDPLRDELVLTGDTSLAARLRVQLAPMVKNLRVQTYQAVDKSMPE